MSRYFGYMVIEFTDGTTERFGGNRDSIHEGVLRVWTDGSYGGTRDHKSWPLINVKSYQWEDER